MKTTIIMIRGCNGSGKSTIVRKLLKKFWNTPIRKNGKLIGYRLDTRGGEAFVLGKYDIPTGGADTIHPVAKIESLVEKFAKRGNVIFEGAMISTISGRWVELSRRLKNSHCIFAVLDTPLKKCLSRIEKRRKKNEQEPLTEKNIKHISGAYRASHVTSPAFLKREGCDVRVLPRKKALKKILHWLRED